MIFSQYQYSFLLNKRSIFWIKRVVFFWFQVARALVEGDVVEDEDDDDEIGKGSGSDESMMMEATDEASVVKKYRVRASYKKQLMLSEWMEVRTAQYSLVQ